MSEERGQVLSSEDVYTGRVFTVKRDRVRLPSGIEATMEVVRHRGSVILLPMPDPGHLILIKQYRYAIDRWIWELAAGSLEPGEDPYTGAVRECEEEIGLRPGHVFEIGNLYPTPGYCDEKMTFFKLTELAPPKEGETFSQPDADEDIRARVFSLEEVDALILNGEIVDQKTAAGLMLLRAAESDEPWAVRSEQ